MSDVTLQDGSVIVTGNLGVGTGNPSALLHVDGNSEIRSSGPGAGFSFSDRHNSNQRWVWYAADGSARLWNGSDAIAVTSNMMTVPNLSICDVNAGSPLHGGKFFAKEAILCSGAQVPLPSNTMPLPAPAIKIAFDEIMVGTYLRAIAPDQPGNFTTNLKLIETIKQLLTRVEALELKLAPPPPIKPLHA
jgi:hypothetical protein